MVESSKLNPSTIDEKKDKIAKKTTNKPVNFFLTLFIQLLYLLITVFVGGLILYSSKVAQSNIIPSDFNCEPYINGENVENLEKIVSSIDVVKVGNIFSSNKIITSNRIYFPYKENIDTINNNLFGVGYLKNWMHGEHTNPFKMYFASIQLDAFSNYSSMMNSVYNTLNQNCTESVIIFLIPYIFIFIVLIVTFINWLYTMYLWFYNLYYLFSKRDDKTNRWKYKYGAIWNFENWFWLFVYFWALVFIFIFLGVGFIIPLLLLKTMICVLFLPLTLSANLENSGNNNKNEEKYTFNTLLANIFRFKRSIIMFYIIFLIIMNSLSMFSVFGFVSAIIACIIIYWFYPQVYEQVIHANDSAKAGLSDYKIAKKKICETNMFGPGENRTFFSFFSNFFTNIINTILDSNRKRRNKQIEGKQMEGKQIENKRIEKISENTHNNP